MASEVSVFVLDVSGSATQEQREYLQQLQINIAYWTQFTSPAKLNFNNGELVAVMNGFASAYILGFYLSRIWKFHEHPPRFGLSFGTIDEDLNTIPIETWDHPLLDRARSANKRLIEQQSKTQFRFEAAYPLTSRDFGNSMEILLNTNANLQQALIDSQTKIQSLVCSLYLILGRQNKVSEYLGRTTSTVSTHMKQGNTELVLDAFYAIVEVLDELGSVREPTEDLQATIRKNIADRLEYYLPLH